MVLMRENRSSWLPFRSFSHSLRWNFLCIIQLRANIS